MIELVRDLRVINVLAKFENDPWKIMDVRVLTGLVCPAARPLGVRQYPGALKGCGVKITPKSVRLTALQWQNVDQTLNSQQTPHTSQASYGVSVERILEKIDRVITEPHCICYVASPDHNDLLLSVSLT